MDDKMMFRLLLLYFEIIVIGAVRINLNERAHYCYDKPTYKEEYMKYEKVPPYIKYEKYFEITDMFDYFSEFSDTQAIDALINKSTEYCNLYEYTCDIWNKVNDKMPHTKGFNQYKIYYNVKKLLNKESKYDQLSVIKKVKQLYQSCMDEDTIEEKGLKPMQELLDATGGWPILMSDEEWNAKNYTWQRIRPFSQNFLGKELKIDIQQSSIDMKTLMQLKLNETGEWPKYMKTIMKVVRAFAKDKGIKISEEKLRMDVIQLIEFEIKLENIIGHKKKMHKIIYTAGDKMTIAQLQEYYDVDGPRFKAKINWRYLIKIALDQLFIDDISDSETVVVFYKEILHDLGYLLNVTPQHVIVNYLQWHVVRIFMSNLNKEMRNIESEYYYSHDIHPSKIINYETEQRWLKCIEEFQMKDALFYLYVKSYISENDIQAVSNIFEDVKKEMIHYMKHSMKQNELTNLMMQKIYNISLHIVYPDWHDDQIIVEKYEWLKIHDYYLVNVLAIIRYENILRSRNFREFNYIDENLYRWSLDFLSNKPSYNEPSNEIEIPAIMMQYPYFSFYASEATNYGAIGSIIGQLLVRSAYFYIESYFDDYDNLTLKAEIRQAFEKGSRCFFKRGHNFIQNVVNEENPEYIKLYENLVKDEILAHFIGMQVASQAFIAKKSFSLLDFYELLEDYICSKSEINFTPEQLFFLINTLLICGMKNPYENFINITSVRMQMTDNLVNIWTFPAAFNNCSFKCVNNVRLFDEF